MDNAEAEDLMPRTISSKLTIFFKFIMPAFVCVALVWNIIAVVSGRFSYPFDRVETVVVALFGVAWIILAGWSFRKLNRVRIDDEFLYVSNYWEPEWRIPISDIYDVTEFRWTNIHPVTIHLKNSTTDLGNKIVFAPTYRHNTFFSDHPIVAELKAIARTKSPTGRLSNPTRPGLFGRE